MATESTASLSLQSRETTTLIESFLTLLSSTVIGAAVRSNLTFLRMPSQPSAPLNAVDFTVSPDCVTSIQPSADSVIL